MRKMQENTDHNLGKDSELIINEFLVISALESTELALESGLRSDQIIISCKTSRPRDLITVYRDLSAKTERSEEHTSELQSLRHLVCRLLLEKKKKKSTYVSIN